MYEDLPLQFYVKESPELRAHTFWHFIDFKNILSVIVIQLRCVTPARSTFSGVGN